MENNHNNGSRDVLHGIKLPSGEDPGDGLGPLPAKWETAYTERGELYFIDHNTGTSHWLDPRLSKYQKKSLEDCGDNELPYGWEKIEDSLYGTYYIDHVNRKTQYENPVLEAKRRAAEQTKQQQNPNLNQQQQQQQQGKYPQQPQPQTHQASPPSFAATMNTMNMAAANANLSRKHFSATPAPPPPPPPPTTATATSPSNAEISTTTRSNMINVKSDISRRGKLQPPPLMQPYKFTRNPHELKGERINTQLVKTPRGLGITIVGGDDGGEEFLQIKSIVPHGAAWIDGTLQTGDVLVYVNDTCVLGFTHHDMVGVFQSILPGESVNLEVCRGYTLPFDPNDPNTEVVTTNAVDNVPSERVLNSTNMEGTYSVPRNNAFSGFILKKRPEILSISMLKGVNGFGFTIADCDQGQKVKKILERQIGMQVQEGDVLLEINNTAVRHKSHQEVVQLLKECSQVLPTLFKVEREANTNNEAYSSISGNVAKLRRNFLSNVALFRSKTPTAELYSTQQKEILPMRPKTPLVDTRRARVQTPNMELQANTNDDTLDGDESKKTVKPAKSFQDIDDINQDIPYMDPYPKLVTSLSERLAEATLQTDNLTTTGLPNLGFNASRSPYADHHEYVSASQFNNATYALPHSMSVTGGPLHHNTLSMTTNSQPLYAAVSYPQKPPVHAPSTPSQAPALVQHQSHQPHDSCYCYDCQDYRAANRFRAGQMNYQSHYSPSALSQATTLAGNMPLQSAQIQNERMQKRVNELLNDRRKVGFSSLDMQQQQQQQQQQKPQLQQQQSQQQQHSPSVNSLTSQTTWMVGASGSGGSHHTTLLDQMPETEQYELSEVTLERQSTGFGFRIVGGTEEGSQVTVGHVVPGGAADMDHRINTGDEILSIDGINVLNTSHHKVVSLMGEAALRGYVTMILRRKMRHNLLHQQYQQQSPQLHLQQQQQHQQQQQQLQQQQSQQQQYSLYVNQQPLPPPPQPQQQHQAQTLSYGQSQQQHQPSNFTISPHQLSPQVRQQFPYDVIVNRHENEGFGFVIISSSNQYYGSTIGKLIPGSPSDRCGELKVGDRIIAVNQIDIAGMPHGDVVNLIKESGLHVRLTIGSPKELLSSTQVSPRQVIAAQTQQQLTQSSPLINHQQQQQHQQTTILNDNNGGSGYFSDRAAPTHVNQKHQHQQQLPQL